MKLKSVWAPRALAALGLVAGLTLAQRNAEAPRWWRGNLHTHTLWSDGDQFPDMVATWYRDQGYHFLALSDHNLLSQGERWMPESEINRRAAVDAVAPYLARFGPSWVETRAGGGGREIRLKTLDETRTLVDQPGRFLMISSEELTGSSGDGRSLHMNATNLVEPVAFQSAATVRESMVRNLAAVEEAARRTGRETMVHVNHPNYRWGVTAEDLAAVVGERFFEVWNGVDGDNDPGDGVRAGTEEIWDIATTLRLLRYQAPPLYGLATDDSHDYHGNRPRAQPGRAWVMVRASHLSPQWLIRALRAGDFYSSTGVELEDVRFDAGARRLTLRIRGRGGETYRTRFIGTRRGAATAGQVRKGPGGDPRTPRSTTPPRAGRGLARCWPNGMVWRRRTP